MSRHFIVFAGPLGAYTLCGRLIANTSHTHDTGGKITCQHCRQVARALAREWKKGAE